MWWRDTKHLLRRLSLKQQSSNNLDIQKLLVRLLERNRRGLPNVHHSGIPGERCRGGRQVDVVNRPLVRIEEAEVGFDRIPTLLIFIEEGEDVCGNPSIRPHGRAVLQHMLGKIIVVRFRILDVGAHTAPAGRPAGLRDHQRHVTVAETFHCSDERVHLHCKAIDVNKIEFFSVCEKGQVWI